MHLRASKITNLSRKLPLNYCEHSIRVMHIELYERANLQSVHRFCIYFCECYGSKKKTPPATQIDLDYTEPYQQVFIFHSYIPIHRFITLALPERLRLQDIYGFLLGDSFPNVMLENYMYEV